VLLRVRVNDRDELSDIPCVAECDIVSVSVTDLDSCADHVTVNSVVRVVFASESEAEKCAEALADGAEDIV